MAHEEIAIALGISRNTLEKHFQWELSIGAHQCRAEVLEAMYRTAKKGVVAAQKAYVQMGVPVAAPPVENDTPEPAKLGKKEQQQADAKVAQVGTDWETLLDINAPLQ